MERVGKWLGRPREIYNLLRFKMGGGAAVMPPLDQVSGAGILAYRNCAASGTHKWAHTQCLIDVTYSFCGRGTLVCQSNREKQALFRS
uniref:Uncharacterized protein n=1 Tax=Terrapene triunguis TaxID=2587831 RepID=A0A674ICC3_9SAUR